MISFIVPAHNEQACLPRTLQAIHESALATGHPYEVIVVDDASTDATAEIARQQGARVVSVNHRQIAATRNSGGRAATGDRFFFVDADTTINARSVAAALRAMDKGAAGGGAATLFDGMTPLYIRFLAYLSVPVPKLIGFTGGAFMFCTRRAFYATGGFNERLYWAEEGEFALLLKREGRFIVVWQPVLTSGRRFRTMSGKRLFTTAVRMLSSRKMFTDRSAVEKLWYDSNRENDDRVSDKPGLRIVNGIILIFLIVLFTGPLWNFVPRSLTPLESPLGKIRFVTGILLCHAGLAFWPCALLLFGSLLRRKQWIEWMKLAALVAFSLWQAWGCTGCVIRHWIMFGRWLEHYWKG